MPKSNPTKMGSDSMSNEWRIRAKALFFNEKLNIVQIADIVGVSRKTVGSYLASIDGYETERENRKLISKAKRKEYQREWDRKNRNTINYGVQGEVIRREHELAVMELSHEKYH